MYRQQSLSKLSTRSLSKIKSKVEVAFSKPINKENQNKLEQKEYPIRSNSVKSLVRSRCSSTEKNIPYSLAVKNKIFPNEKKSLAFQSEVQQKKCLFKEKQKVNEITEKQRQRNLLKCMKTIKNEDIYGYSWFHSKQKQIKSVSKKSNHQTLRYFAIDELVSGKVVKKVIAAIQDGVIYAGSKKYMLIRTNGDKLISKNQNSKLMIKESQAIFVVDKDLINFMNVSKLITDFYDLIRNGNTNLDKIVEVLCSKIIETSKKYDKEIEDLFLLVILVDPAVLKNSI